MLAGEEVTQFYTDISGSPVVAIQQQYINGVSTGVIQWRAYREPYGQRITSQPDTEEYPLQFTAKSEDFETGLTYFGARYYNAEVGRFYAIDPAGFDPGNIHSVNRYVYANNNPYKYVDPDGRQSIELDALLRTEVALPTDIPNAFGGGGGGGGLRFSNHSSSPRHALRVRAHTDAPGVGIGAKQSSKVPKNVLKRDLTKGPHAPDTKIEKVIDRAIHGDKSGTQGRWNSRDAAQRAANQNTGGKHSVPIQKGDGVLITPLPNRGGVMIREAERAVTIPKKNGDIHTFPIGSEHPDF